MKEKPTPSTQLRLTLPVRSPATMSAEMERQLITALTDLLVAVATGGKAGATEGARDEREDP